MARRKIQGRRAIVTGASSGIGAAIARQLVRKKATVLITARRRERLDELAIELTAQGGQVFTLPGDITDPEHRTRLLRYAERQMGGLDILVNNAGVGAVGKFWDTKPERLRQIMEVNFFAAVELIRESHELLAAADRATIVNISSVLGHCAVPSKSEYCASKFALHGFSDSLRAEFAKSRIDVLLVSPSTTSTEFFDNLLEDQGTAVKSPYGVSPDTVARKTVSAIRRGQHEIILPWSGRMLVWLDRLWPAMANRLVRRLG